MAMTTGYTVILDSIVATFGGRGLVLSYLSQPSACCLHRDILSPNARTDEAHNEQTPTP